MNLIILFLLLTCSLRSDEPHFYGQVKVSLTAKAMTIYGGSFNGIGRYENGAVFVPYGANEKIVKLPLGGDNISFLKSRKGGAYVFGSINLPGYDKKKHVIRVDDSGDLIQAFNLETEDSRNKAICAAGLFEGADGKLLVWFNSPNPVEAGHDYFAEYDSNGKFLGRTPLVDPKVVSEYLKKHRDYFHELKNKDPKEYASRLKSFPGILEQLDMKTSAHTALKVRSFFATEKRITIVGDISNAEGAWPQNAELMTFDRETRRWDRPRISVGGSVWGLNDLGDECLIWGSLEEPGQSNEGHALSRYVFAEKKKFEIKSELDKLWFGTIEFIDGDAFVSLQGNSSTAACLKRLNISTGALEPLTWTPQVTHKAWIGDFQKKDDDWFFQTEKESDSGFFKIEKFSGDQDSASRVTMLEMSGHGFRIQALGKGLLCSGSGLFDLYDAPAFCLVARDNAGKFKYGDFFPYEKSEQLPSPASDDYYMSPVVECLKVVGDELIIGGDFSRWSGDQGLARLNLKSGKELPFGIQIVGKIDWLSSVGDLILFGGQMESFKNKNEMKFCRIGMVNFKTGEITGFGTDIGGDDCGRRGYGPYINPPVAEGNIVRFESVVNCPDVPNRNWKLDLTDNSFVEETIGVSQ